MKFNLYFSIFENEFIKFYFFVFIKKLEIYEN